jgi:hypothetical protein
MSFRPLRPCTVRWRPEGAEGLEHLDLRPAEGAIVADGVVIGARGGVPYGVRYRLVCDATWVTRRLDLETTDGRGVTLRADGAGSWTDGDGRALTELAGAIDLDLAGSPFTNTLPIRRSARLATGEAVEFRMAYVPFDTFRPTVDEQRYRCLEPGRLYRYEAVDRTFAADLPVDEDGLVTDYPGLFTRIQI